MRTVRRCKTQIQTFSKSFLSTFVWPFLQIVLFVFLHVILLNPILKGKLSDVVRVLSTFIAIFFDSTCYCTQTHTHTSILQSIHIHMVSWCVWQFLLKYPSIVTKHGETIHKFTLDISFLPCFQVEPPCLTRKEVTLRLVNQL